MICVALPVYNEADGLEEFLLEIRHALVEYDPQFIVVNDCSTDRTADVLESMKKDGFPLMSVTNARNSGHGFSVLAGLRLAIDKAPDYIILCDGDGQFLGSDIRKMYETASQSRCQVVEGVRTGRNDAWFRRLTTKGTRLLVSECVGISPRDANTPLRVMPRTVAERLIGHIPPNCMTPNLVSSALVRALGIEVLEMDVASRPPRRDSDHVDHWKQRIKSMPSRRFIRFVFDAGVQWWSIRTTIKKLGQKDSQPPTAQTRDDQS